jgi:hypothetical protein
MVDMDTASLVDVHRVFGLRSIRSDVASIEARVDGTVRVANEIEVILLMSLLLCWLSRANLAGVEMIKVITVVAVAVVVIAVILVTPS